MQDLGFLAFTLPAIRMPTKKLRGLALTWEQQRANQALTQRRLRIEPGNRSVKRCRIVKDRIRLWKAGLRDVVMERCGALHHCRVRLHPWLPMLESGYAHVVMRITSGPHVQDMAMDLESKWHDILQEVRSSDNTCNH